MDTPLAIIRKLRGQSKVDVAKAVKCTKSHYLRVESGAASPSAALAARIALHFDNEISEQRILYPLRYVAAKQPQGGSR